MAARILIVGVSTRALAESAKKAGYDFLTLDYFGDYDQKGWCENYSLKRDSNQAYGAAALYEVSRRLQYQAVVYTASLENYPHIVRRLAAGAERAGSVGGPPVLGNRPEVLAKVRHAPTVLRFLACQGVPVPETLGAGQTANGPDAAGDRRWLRKPIRSGGGRHIRFWPGNRPVGAGFVLQQYLAGRPCSMGFIANGRDAVVLGVSEQWIGRPEFGGRDFTYCGNIYPLPGHEDTASADLMHRLTAIATALTCEFDLVGLNGMDFILAEGHVWPVEINPRYTASMELMEWAVGCSMFDWHVRAVCEDVLPTTDAVQHAQNRAYYSKAILYAERDCRAPDLSDWAERDIRDVPFPGEDMPAGSPICTVLASGATADACYARLMEQVEQLKGALYA